MEVCAAKAAHVRLLRRALVAWGAARREARGAEACAAKAARARLLRQALAAWEAARRDARGAEACAADMARAGLLRRALAAWGEAHSGARDTRTSMTEFAREAQLRHTFAAWATSRQEACFAASGPVATGRAWAACRQGTEKHATGVEASEAMLASDRASAAAPALALAGKRESRCLLRAAQDVNPWRGAAGRSAATALGAAPGACSTGFAGLGLGCRSNEMRSADVRAADTRHAAVLRRALRRRRKASRPCPTLPFRYHRPAVTFYRKFIWRSHQVAKTSCRVQ